jgi:hypothetical protein
LLQQAGAQQLDPVTTCRDDLCDLGQWLYGNGRRVFGHLDLFEDLRKQHAGFHLVAAEIVHAVRAGRGDHPQQLMAQDYQLNSEQVQRSPAELFLQHHA